MVYFNGGLTQIAKYEVASPIPGIHKVAHPYCTLTNYKVQIQPVLVLFSNLTVVHCIKPKETSHFISFGKWHD